MKLKSGEKLPDAKVFIFDKEPRETSIKHCNSYNKDTYVFWSQYEGSYARDQNGNFLPDMYGPIFGIIQDLQYGLSVRARYFCAEKVEEALI